jgi:Arc/MetJ-type ribon-helix-helix transcriptional regulator
MAKERTTVFLEQSDREAAERIKAAHMFDSRSDAIRYALRVIDERENAKETAA